MYLSLQHSSAWKRTMMWCLLLVLIDTDANMRATQIDKKVTLDHPIEYLLYIFVFSVEFYYAVAYLSVQTYVAQ